MFEDHFHDDGSKRPDKWAKMPIFKQLDAIPLNEQNLVEYLVICENAAGDEEVDDKLVGYVKKAQEWIESNLTGAMKQSWWASFTKIELKLKGKNLRDKTREKIQ